MKLIFDLILEESDKLLKAIQSKEEESIKKNKLKLKGNIICFGMFHTAINKPKEKKEVKRKLAKREQ